MSKDKTKFFNSINWFEIPTGDLDRAVTFYERVLGVTLTREIFGGLPHAIFPAKCPEGGSAAGGAIVAQAPYLEPGTAGTRIYLHCFDGVKASLERAVAAGATVTMPHTSIGPMGFIAMIDDLDGNRIGLHADLA